MLLLARSLLITDEKKKSCRFLASLKALRKYFRNIAQLITNVITQVLNDKTTSLFFRPYRALC